MQIEEAIFWGQQSLIAIGSISGPILLATLVVGVIVSLFQAVTQLQEMTIVFVPKIIMVFLLFAVLGGWMLESLVAFSVLCFSSIEQSTE
jgi:flagellar biosynthetic protein FliQ